MHNLPSTLPATRRVLLVEDDPDIAAPLTYSLEREGWSLVWVTLARDAMNALEREPFDALVLDVGLPDMDGFELCRQIRLRWNTPLLFLTARADEVERIIGLELGADDYCAKPFSSRELTTRLKAIWRRTEQPKNPPLDSTSTEQPHQYGPFLIDPVRLQIQYYGISLALTRYEYRLLATLVEAPERVFTRLQLMQAGWDHPDHSLERTVDSHIKTVRHKLRLIHPDDPIHTHRGVGYSLNCPSALTP